MTGTVTVRRATEDAAPALAALALANREFPAPWEPVRPDVYFTEGHQRAALRATTAQDPPGTGTAAQRPRRGDLLERHGFHPESASPRAT